MHYINHITSESIACYSVQPILEKKVKSKQNGLWLTGVNVKRHKEMTKEKNQQ